MSPLKSLFRKKKSVAESPDPHRKSNIYVDVVLAQLIQNLERDKENLNHTLASQVGYFHLIIPKDLSHSLASDWIAIRHFVGFEDSVDIFDAEKMKAPIRKRASQFTQADIEELMTMLYALQAKLNAEHNH
ncbi:hypothetical protein [Salmonirosea aquatica]|uniref:Uncharacterized protein n=1 Tax=Salmonirosea aquatica TaxID=2654236 RepID=A0A7C9FQE8_9BACT|nr:hypothetical protein [Cytophagaceae bacterium SJW1-29]